jgi:hypothetical protein
VKAIGSGQYQIIAGHALQRTAGAFHLVRTSAVKRIGRADAHVMLTTAHPNESFLCVTELASYESILERDIAQEIDTTRNCETDESEPEKRQNF